MNPLLITTYAVLVGLTPLIPIPLLDDFVKGFFYRKMVSALAAAHHIALQPKEIEALSEEPSRGCLRGCVFGTVEFLIKALVRKIIFILEWRRAIDLVTHTYYVGHLMDYAFRQGWYTPGNVEQAARLRVAIEEARKGANTNLVKRSVQNSFNQSRQLIINTVEQISDSLKDFAFRRSRIWMRRVFAVRLRRRFPKLARWLFKRLRPIEAEKDPADKVERQVQEKLETETPRWSEGLSDFVARLQDNLTALPREHFEGLEKVLEKSLKPTA